MLDKIIKSCKYVVKNSKSVKINEAKVDEFIETIKNIKIWKCFWVWKANFSKNR